MSLILRILIASTKVFLVFFFIGTLLLASFLLGLFVKDKWSLVRIGNKMISGYCNLGLKILGIEVEWKGQVDPKENHLIVSNHLSYTDILALAATVPSSFVTSVEIKNTPVLGNIVKAAGCLFVERRNKDNIGKEVAEITEALAKGFNVTIFPEATSTNGESVLRFRRPLYEAALQSGKKVLPLCINYKSIDGEKITMANRDLAFWYGDMEFLPHLWNLALHKNIVIEITVLDEITMKESLNVDDLATTSHEAVSKAYRPVLGFS